MTRPLDPDMFTACATDDPPIRIGDKWTAKVIVCLRDGPRRFSELAAPLRPVTAKVLTETLRAMRRDGLIARTSFGGMPPHVEYELTDLGRSLLAPMEAACAWSREHLSE